MSSVAADRIFLSRAEERDPAPAELECCLGLSVSSSWASELLSLKHWAVSSSSRRSTRRRCLTSGRIEPLELFHTSTRRCCLADLSCESPGQIERRTSGAIALAAAPQNVLVRHAPSLSRPSLRSRAYMPVLPWRSASDATCCVAVHGLLDSSTYRTVAAH